MEHFFNKAEINIDSLPEVVILAAGEMPGPNTPGREILNIAAASKTKKLICCDGAFNRLSDLNLPFPDIVVGDFDSITKENRERLGAKLYHVAEQDTNDLTKSVRYAMKEFGAKRLCILALTGLREDHALGNMALLPTYIKHGLEEIIIPTNFGTMYAFRGKAEIKAEKGTQVSIFTFDRAEVTTKGLKWELDHQRLEELWMGTLNEMLGNSFMIESPQPILVYVANDVKKH